MKKLMLVLFIATTLISCKESIRPNVYEGNARTAILDNMLTRRAIRKYTPQQVSHNLIDSIMKYAIYAPSSYNKQPYEIRVVQNAQWLTELNKRYTNEHPGEIKFKGEGFSIFHNSPTLVVIAGDTTHADSHLDIGIVVQNVMLAAHALGLATCPLVLPIPTLNNPDNRDLLDALNISKDHEAVVCVSMGYGAESPAPRLRNADRVKIIE